VVKGLVFDIKKYSIHDGPGIRTTVFFKGCPGACWWCHNPESRLSYPEIVYRPDRCILCEKCVEVCPNNAIYTGANGIETDTDRCRLCGRCVEACPSQARERVGRTITVTDLVCEVERDILFYDESGGGVTFSGGEPLFQYDFLLAVLKECREREIHTAVDTMGYADTDLVLEIAEHTDLFLFDLKLMDPAWHLEYVGVPNEGILDNLKALDRRGSPVLVRIPLVPGINDDRENLEKTARFIASLSGIRSVSVLPYHDSAAEKYRRFGIENKMLGLGTDGPSSAGQGLLLRHDVQRGLSVEHTLQLFEGYGLDVQLETGVKA
jgi:pyruvate formate lyase activating enzyme